MKEIYRIILFLYFIWCPIFWGSSFVVMTSSHFLLLLHFLFSGLKEEEVQERKYRGECVHILCSPPFYSGHSVSLTATNFTNRWGWIHNWRASEYLPEDVTSDLGLDMISNHVQEVLTRPSYNTGYTCLSFSPSFSPVDLTNFTT